MSRRALVFTTQKKLHFFCFTTVVQAIAEPWVAYTTHIYLLYISEASFEKIFQYFPLFVWPLQLKLTKASLFKLQTF